MTDSEIPYAKTMDELQKVFAEADKPVLVDFTATWCGPCKALLPVLEELHRERDDFTIVKVDVDENPDAAEKYEIQGVPTMVLVEEGDDLVRLGGAMSKADLLARIDPFI